MGAEASLGRRAGTVARWPVGMGLAFWRYLWRTMPLHRSDEDGSPGRDLPPPLPDGLASDRLQRLEDGSGPLFRRRYRVRIEGSRRTPEELMAELLREPNRAAPRPGRSSSAPAPTATASASRSSHGPAAATGSPGCCTTGSSWPRRCSCTCGPTSASGRPSCPAGASAAASTSTPAGSSSRAPVAADRRGARRALEALAGKGFNFDPDQRDDHYTTGNGWKVDDYLQPLPPEPSGPPAPGGS